MPAYHVARALGWVIVAVAWLTTAYLVTLQYGLLGDDDNLYLYSTGLAAFRPNEVRELNRDVSAWSAAHLGTPATQRWLYRVRYERNYLLPSTVLYAASRWIGPGSHASYVDFLAIALPAGFGAMFGLSVLTLAVGLAALRSSRIAGLAAVVVLVDVGTSFVLDERGPYRVILPGDPIGSARAAIAFMVNPENAFTTFGHTPRSSFALLMLLVFAWRLHGWYAASYWLIAGLGFVHQGCAGLAVASLAAVDLARRPRVLLEYRTAIAVAAAATLFLVRDGLLFAFVDRRSAAIAAAGMLAIGIGYIAGRRWRNKDASPARPVAGVRLSETRDGGCDALILIAIVAAAMVVAFPIGARSDPFQAEIFWYELPGRLGSILRPGILLLAVHATAEAFRGVFPQGFRASGVGRSLPSLALAVALAGAALMYAQHGRHGILGLRPSLARVEDAVADFGPAQPLQLRESVLYLTLDRTVDRRDGALATLLRR